MTKTEYQNSITNNLTAAEALCDDLRKLRALQKLTATITGGDKLVSLELVGKTITEKEAQLKKIRSELGKARRIVKHMEEIEAIENGTEKKPTVKKSAVTKEKAPEPADKKKTGKTPKAEKPASAQGKAQPAA